MRSAFLCGFTRPRVVIPHRRFGTTYWSRLQGLSSPAWPLNVGQIGSSEASVQNCHSTLRKITQDGRSQQDRQCTSNVTLRRFRAAILAVEKQRVLYAVSVCSLRYPACKAHVPYLHLWPAPLYNLFSHFLTSARFSRKKKVIEHITCVLTSSTTFVQNISHSKKKWAGYAQKCVLVFM